MHRFSWRMATVQMRLMLHREYVGRSECVYHHALFIQPNMTPLICLLKLCDHTFCHPMTHLPFLCLCVRPSNVCCAFTCYLSQSCHLCVCKYCVFIELQIEHLPRCPCNPSRPFHPPPSHVLLLLTSNCSRAHRTVLHQAF